MLLITKKKIKHYWPIYLLIFVPVILVAFFSYYPLINGFIHIFYRWDGDTIEEFTGFENIIRVFNDGKLWRSFLVVMIFVTANVIKMIPAIICAVILHHIISDGWQYIYRILFVVPMIIPQLVRILLWKYFYEPNVGILNSILRTIGYLEPMDTIQWLDNPILVIPSLVFQGFPWVGAFSVLIFLAGLQNIPKSLYEAARIDGANAFQIFRKIELPLIATQVRIMLVLMIIRTLRGWQFIYFLLGEHGGPGGIATVPGLYIFREAFSRGKFGYGCAVGFLVFLITLSLTYINNKYVRVDK